MTDEGYLVVLIGLLTLFVFGIKLLAALFLVYLIIVLIGTVSK
jgi:hypothetical protein